jgi:hypothetical protein
MSLILALRRPKQKDCKFKATLGYIVRLCLKKLKAKAQKQSYWARGCSRDRVPPSKGEDLSSNPSTEKINKIQNKLYHIYMYTSLHTHAYTLTHTHTHIHTHSLWAVFLWLNTLHYLMCTCQQVVVKQKNTFSKCSRWRPYLQ